LTQLEKDIERKLRLTVAKYGGKCLKWTCPGWSGVPDRIILLPNGRVMFVETKRPKGGTYSAMQDKWRDWLHDLGFDYWRIKDAEELLVFELILSRMVGGR
jgi:hypothetical protein